MAKGKKGKLRSVHAHIEPMKDSKGNQGYKVHVHSHFEPDGDEGKQGMSMPTSSEPEPTFATSRKQAIGHMVKHASKAMAMHEGLDADGDNDGDESMPMPANHPLKKLRRGY